MFTRYLHALFGAVLTSYLIICLVSCSDEEVPGARQSSGGQASSAMQVRAVQVQQLPLSQNLSASGTFTANESVEITSEYAGSIHRIAFCEGCPVEKGEVLIALDQRDINARIDRLNVDIALAKKELDRAENLRSIQAISEEELQRQENRVESLEAERKVLLVQRSKMNLRAPFPGKVGLRRVSPGSYIQPGTVVTTLQQIDPIKLEFDVPEEYAHALGEGDTIHFTASRSPDRHPAVIYASEAGINLTTRSRTFRARADNPDGQFLPGGYADVSYAPSADKLALLVPAEAIVQEVRGQVVFKVVGGKAQKQKVSIGTRTQNAVELKSGVRAGDTVMVTGLLNVSNGMPVDVSIQDIIEKD